MEIFVVVAGVLSIWLLVKLFGSYVASILSMGLKAAWVCLVGVTAVSLLSFWNIGLSFSGATLIAAIAGLIVTIWVHGKMHTDTRKSYEI